MTKKQDTVQEEILDYQLTPSKPILILAAVIVTIGCIGFVGGVLFLTHLMFT